jgi:hypothetical protein
MVIGIYILWSTFWNKYYNIYPAPWTAKSVNELIENIHNKPLMFPDGIKKVSDLTKDVIRKCLIVNESTVS